MNKIAIVSTIHKFAGEHADRKTVVHRMRKAVKRSAKRKFALFAMSDRF